VRHGAARVRESDGVAVGVLQDETLARGERLGNSAHRHGGGYVDARVGRCAGGVVEHRLADLHDLDGGGIAVVVGNDLDRVHATGAVVHVHGLGSGEMTLGVDRVDHALDGVGSREVIDEDVVDVQRPGGLQRVCGGRVGGGPDDPRLLGGSRDVDVDVAGGEACRDEVDAGDQTGLLIADLVADRAVQQVDACVLGVGGNRVDRGQSGVNLCLQRGSRLGGVCAVRRRVEGQILDLAEQTVHFGQRAFCRLDQVDGLRHVLLHDIQT